MADGRYNTPVAMAEETSPEPTPEPAGREAAAPPPPSDAPVEQQPVAEQPPAEQPTPEQPAAEQPPPEQPAAEQPPPEPPAAEQPPAEQPAAEQPAAAKPRRRGGQSRPRGGRRERPPREKGPLPFAELREAATAVNQLVGARRALRDAFSVLGDKERADLSRLVEEDGDWRVRARNIAAGSLGAGRIGKALAAQQISMAVVDDLWSLTLSKEEAASRQARVRDARRRDERRAKRDAERESRSDRVSRAELAKAQDGRVGAQIRIVMPGEPRGPRRKDEKPGRDEHSGGSGGVLDRLGY